MKSFLELYATRLLVGIVLASSAVFAQAVLTRSQALEAARNSASVLAAQARVAASEAQASAAGLPISGTANAGYAMPAVNPPTNASAHIPGPPMKNATMMHAVHEDVEHGVASVHVLERVAAVNLDGSVLFLRPFGPRRDSKDDDSDTFAAAWRKCLPKGAVPIS